MLQLALAFAFGIGATLLAFSLRPHPLVRRFVSVWVPLAEAHLRTLAAGALIGAALTTFGFVEGQRYMALPPADMRAVAASMDRASAANLVLERSVSDFSAEVDRLFRREPVAAPIVVTHPAN